MSAGSGVLRVSSQIPATAANLGPGFDCLGVALHVHDDYRARVVIGNGSGAPAVSVHIDGEGADGSIPTDGQNLVSKALFAGLAAWQGPPVAELELTCVNRIPHGRGLGSSSTAIVGGLLLARELCFGDVSDDAVLALATEIEGHPDNVAPALLGGFTVSWTSEVGSRPQGRAVRLVPSPELTPIVAIPASTLSTAHARSLVWDEVSMADAVFNLSRSALLVAALTTTPERIFEATDDRLHQQQRAQAYVSSHALMSILRMDGHAATISGAGPTVLTFAPSERADDTAREIAEYTGVGWEVKVLSFALAGGRATVE